MQQPIAFVIFMQCIVEALDVPLPDGVLALLPNTAATDTTAP